MRKLWMFVLLGGSALAVSPKTIISSQPFTDVNNNALANGLLVFRLANSDLIVGGPQLMQGLTYTVTLTSSGFIPKRTTLWTTDQMQTTGNYYIINIYNQNGLLVRGPENWHISGASPIDLSQEVNAILPDPGLSQPVLLNGAGNQSVSQPVILTNPGILNGGSSNNWFSSVINSANWNTNNAAQEPEQSGTLGAISVPSGATSMHQANGLFGYADSSCNSASGTRCNVDGGYFVGQALASNAAVWGINPVAYDNPGLTGTWVQGGEFDVACKGTCAFVNGINIEIQGTGICQSVPCSSGLSVIQGFDNSGGNWLNYAFKSLNQNTATSSTTYFAAPTAWESSYWNGTTGTNVDILTFGPNGGIGANPFINYEWEHPQGTPGQVAIGPQYPLVFELFGTNNIGVAFSLSNTSPSSNKSISVPNDTKTSNLMGLNQNATDGVYMSKRGVSGCTTAGSIGGICATAITVTWPASFQDTNYSAGCNASGAPTNLPSSPYVVTKSAGSMTVNYFAITAAAASWATVDCWAIHD